MSDFIAVTKDGEVIEIHPDALKDHERLGWKVCENVPVANPAPISAIKSEDKKIKK